MLVVSLSAAMKDIAKGNFEVPLAGLGRGDEVGDMAQAVLVFKADGMAKLRLEAEQQKAARDAQTRRQEEIDQLIGFFKPQHERLVQVAVGHLGRDVANLDVAGKRCAHHRRPGDCGAG